MRLVDIECSAVTEVIGRRAFTSRDDIREFLDNIPTADAELIRRGKWEFSIWAGQKYYKCSCCGKDYPLPPTWNTYDVNKYLKYCSACGARMNKEN